MAETATQLRSEQKQNLSVNFSCKIAEERFAGGTYYTTVTLPGADEYSSAMPLELRSDRSLGQTGQVVRIAADLGGAYLKSFSREEVDPRTGVVSMRTVRPIRNVLDARLA